MEFGLISIVKNQLNFLQNLNPTVVGELCKLAWELISKGVSSNIYSSIANKLETTRDVVEEGIQGIACLIFQINTSELTEDEFIEAATLLKLENSILREIYSTYENNRESLQALSSVGISPAQFSGLEWRLQSELASRSRISGLDPRVLIKLDLTKGGAPESIALVADIPNVIRWNEMVEQALAESRTQNARRIHRAIS